MDTDRRICLLHEHEDSWSAHSFPEGRTGIEAQDDILDDLRDNIEEAETPQWIVDALIEMNTGSAAGRRG